ncbi:MAG: S9 family peptidase [Gemmatimonadales bacterium]
MRTLFMLCLAVFTFSPLTAQTRGLQPQDYYRMTFVGDVALSPTGDLVAYTVTTVNEAENERHREVWLQRLRDGRPDGAPFRFTDPTEESSGPRWSPDGTVLSFTSRRGEDQNSTWFARVTAPGGEAYHVEGVTGAPVWSSDGAWIAYVRAPDDGAEEGENRRVGWIAPNAISRTLDARRFDGRVITSMRYKRDGTRTLLPDYRSRDKRQLYVVPAAGGTPRQVTDGPFDVGSIAWMPNGRTIVFAGNPEQDDELNQEQTSDLYAVSVSGGTPQRLTTNPGSESDPAISPNGRLLAFVQTQDRLSQPELLVVNLTADGAFDGTPRVLTGEWDLIADQPVWMPDNRTIRFTTGVGGNSHVFEVAATGGAVRQVTTGDRRVGGVSWNGNGRLMAYTSTDAQTPGEVFVARGDGSREVRVTGFNDAWLSEVALMPAERLTWTVGDGTEIEGWVIRPVGHQAGQRYPMILKIHGGPYGAYGNTFFQTFHVLSAAGFYVLYVNPRGSTGYGRDYQYATLGGWGEIDSEDFLRGVDAALARYPDIDPTRVGVSGGSYGGFMSNWLTATSDRFAASVTSRSIANWETMYGTSDAHYLTEHAFEGSPWEARDTFRRLSPLSYVEHVTAPTLIIHSENDYRTPIPEGEMWFKYLMRNGVPTELVRYPRSSHGLSRTGEPWLLVDRLERIRSWFAHWLIEVQAERATQ